jgi:alpha-glucosidase
MRRRPFSLVRRGEDRGPGSLGGEIMISAALRRAAAALLLALGVAGSALAQSPSPGWSVRSPDGRAEIAFRMSGAGGVEYRALFHPRSGRARTAIDWSSAGVAVSLFNTFDMREPVVSDFTRTISFVGAERTRGEDVYTLVAGKRLENRSAYAQLSLTFRDDETQRLLRIDARAYKDGVAFRYVLPETSVMYYHLESEATAFNIGLGATHWGQPYDFYTMYNPSYETLYDARPSGTATPANAGTGWGFPSLFERSGLWTLVHETGLDETFQGSHLQPEAPGGIYHIAPPLAAESMGFGADFPTATLPWTMPWRFAIISDDIGDIVESNLVFDLAEPSRVADTSWIHPGVASWNWASDHASGTDLAKLRGFIDLAADMGWPYTLIDANWNLAGPHAMEDLLAYARGKNVGLLFWYNSGGRHNAVTEQPRNLMDDRMTRRAEFARISALGVRGVKVDFFQSDKQDIIRQYLEILEDAAEFHLMVDFHGCTIPRGWQRTWPNLVTMEAVRGGEFYSFPSEPDYGAAAPRQNAIHPFLRNVVGSMDFTPILFSPRLEIARRTTNAHEAALGVIFESGVTHMEDGVASYRALPAEYKAYLAQLPAAWDETRYIAGAPGDYVVLARRSGARWYVAGINGADAARDVVVDLAALRAHGGALILYDDAATPFASRRRPAGEHGPLRLTMAPRGGFVAAFAE